MDQKGWKSMNAPGDAVIKTATIGKIHHLEVYVDRTFTAFTQTVIFVYKGTPSNDVYSVTTLFKKEEGLWKIQWWHCSSGEYDSTTWDSV